jgi:hypothetical protein
LRDFSALFHIERNHQFRNDFLRFYQIGMKFFDGNRLYFVRIRIQGQGRVQTADRFFVEHKNQFTLTGRSDSGFSVCGISLRVCHTGLLSVFFGGTLANASPAILPFLRQNHSTKSAQMRIFK